LDWDSYTLIEPADRLKFVGHWNWGVMARDNITLQCTECKNRNYVTTKNKKTTPDRLEFKKFCRKCRCHTPHKETK
jgi:large subunit ribosomal protein L33